MKKLIAFLGILLLTISCSDNSPNDSLVMGEMNLMRNSGSGTLDEIVVTSRDNKPVIERKLIKTGNITFEVKELEATRKSIVGLVKQYKGYISNDREYKSSDRLSNTLSVRIPEEKFDVLLKEISKGVDKFDNKSVNISDVTEQFLDTEVRLKTKKALEAKYLEILKKAKTVREILDVERELGKLRGDIESTEGRLKYLQNQVSFSTLNITFYKQIAASETSFIGKISKAFKTGFENVKDFFLYLINIWPFIIILFILFFYLRKRRLRTK